MATTQEKVIKTLLQMIELVKADEDMAEMFADELDCMLDGMSNNDFFGTEGQLDPRGDHRNGKSFNLSD